MSDSRNPFDYPLNPNYGQGVFHRKIRFSKGNDSDGDFVFGELEDCNHGFCIKVYFSNGIVTAIQPEAKRIPLSTCAGAAGPLRDLIGKKIQDSSKALHSQMNPQGNCTHWLDLSIWAINYAAGDYDETHTYHMQIPDELDHGTPCTLHLNQQLLMEWTVKDWVIQTPEAYHGLPFYKGFAAWANKIDDTKLKAAAFILQKAYFVSRARYYDIEALAGEKADNHDMMIGACYSYSPPRVHIAERTSGTVRDFTQQPEQLLRFI
jgi:hypothetical protein